MNVIAHFDIDAFYASVAVRDDPSLRGQPVAIAGSHRRSVVLTASYEARPFGVRSAIPLFRARELCPQLIVVAPDMEKYKRESRTVFEVMRSRGHTVEGLSMDEAFVNLGDVDFAQAVETTAHIRAEIFERTHLTASAGVARGKMIAKIASDACKPNGLKAVEPGTEAAYLAPMPASRLWGVGPKTAARLETAGVRTIGDVAALDDAALHRLFGSWGREVRDLACGIDARGVVAERETKSISTETTFEYDVRDENKLIEVLREQAAEIAGKLEREDCSAATIGIKVKRADFRVFGRQTHLEEPTRDVRRIFKAARHCLVRAHLAGTPIRLLGLRAGSLSVGEPKQISFFDFAPK